VARIQKQLATPVAFIIFNRPELTSAVFAAIAKAKPTVLLVISDGPRDGVIGELETVLLCREIATRVDWPCEVLTNFSDSNLGCRDRVSSGLDWVFTNVEEAIILEDDCLPSADFFHFTSELLAKYRFDERVGSVCGSSSPAAPSQVTDSYYFSLFPAIWGWGTWARVWKNYDVRIRHWPELRNSNITGKLLKTKRAAMFWKSNFDEVYAGRIDTWDYQFSLLHWTKNLLSIVSTKNLVSNIGFGLEATHTLDPNSVFANNPSEEMKFPLTHPRVVARDTDRDENTERQKFNQSLRRIFLTRIFNRLPRVLKASIRRFYSKTTKK
jgi:hypothetical protein